MRGSERDVVLFSYINYQFCDSAKIITFQYETK